MRTTAPHPGRVRLFTAVGMALAVAFIVSIPAAAFDSAWTKPKRVFSYGAAPTHSMVSANGKVHIATERGSGGVWYVTNESGSWNSCQVSSGNDRRPSIAVADGVVHIAWTRHNDGQKGVYTTSSDQAAPAADCGWAITKRWVGGASHAALGVHGSKFSIAFRTSDKKLKFIKGDADDSGWGKAELIDGKCCTSPVALDLTTGGAPRVAYGDGTSKALGLKFATRTGKGWKKSLVKGGRVKDVDMVLDKTPGLFGKPASNSPKLAFVIKKKGMFVATKSNGFSSRGFGKASSGAQIQHASNVTLAVFVRNGDLIQLRTSGGIWFDTKLSGGGGDSKPQLHGDRLTYSRKSGTKGIYFTQRK